MWWCGDGLGWMVGGWIWMDVDVCGWECVKNWTLLLHYYCNFSCAKDANHSQMLGSPDPLVLSFPLKLIGADHGLHTSGGVQIFLLLRDADVRRIRRSHAYAQVWFGDGIYAALRQL